MALGPDRIGRDDSNPYAAPASGPSPALGPIAGDEAAEAIRRDHIMQEASIRSIGVLFYLSAFFGALGTIFLLVAGTSGEMEAPEGVDPAVFAGVLAVIYGGFSAFYFALGRGLRGLRGWARWTTVVLTTIGLLFVVIQAVVFLFISPVVSVLTVVFGGLIPGYILYLLLSAKAGVIFSPAYKEIIQLTPHVKPRTSRLAWIILIVIALIIVGVIVAAIGTS